MSGERGAEITSGVLIDHCCDGWILFGRQDAGGGALLSERRVRASVAGCGDGISVTIFPLALGWARSEVQGVALFMDMWIKKRIGK